MTKFKSIYSNTFQTSNKLDNEINKVKKENNKLVTLNTIFVHLNKVGDYSTDFESINGFSEEEEITILYKQWNIELYTEEHLEDNINFILPFINYEIIYEIPETHSINYYNTHNDLHTAQFFEIRDTLLILHVSCYMKKSYNEGSLVIPRAKLHINWQNPFVINQ